MGIELNAAAINWNLHQMGVIDSPDSAATQAKKQLSSENSDQFSALETANLIRSAVRGAHWETYQTADGARKFLPLDDAFAKTAASHANRLVETAGEDPASRRAAIQCLGSLRECTVVRSAPVQRNVVDAMCSSPLPAWTQPGQLGKLFDSFSSDKNDKGHIRTASYKAAAAFVQHSLPEAEDAGGTMSREEAKSLIGVRKEFKAHAGSNRFSEKGRSATKFKTAFDAKFSGFPAYKAALAEHRKAPITPAGPTMVEKSSQMASAPTNETTQL